MTTLDLRHRFVNDTCIECGQRNEVGAYNFEICPAQRKKSWFRDSIRPNREAISRSVEADKEKLNQYRS